MTRSRSRSPRSPRKGDGDEGGWKCGNCYTSNGDNITSCQKCRLRKGTNRADVFKEDWECCRCFANNFSRRMDCYKCHTKKPPINPKFPDDWQCPDCKGVNFSKRIDCYKCHAPKPLNYSNNYLGGGYMGGANGWKSSGPMGGGVPQYASGAPDCDPVTGETHWICRVCGVSNFYMRLDCYRCFEIKPGGAPRDPNQQQQQGDVRTGAAAVGTYSNALTIPGQPMGGPVQPMGGPVQPPSYNQFSRPGMRKDDWICSSCDGHNFSRRLDCYRCKTVKTENNNAVPVC